MPSFPVISREDFSKMSDVDKRLLITRDALLQISLGLFGVEQGNYISSRAWRRGSDTRLKVYSDLDPHLDVSDPVATECLLNGHCHVCAKGALFLSAIIRTNNLKVDRITEFDGDAMTMHVASLGIFTEDELNLFEGIFEASYRWLGVGDPSADTTMKRTSYLNYTEPFHFPLHRLAAILINIIDNNGYFKPEIKLTLERVKEEIEKLRTAHPAEAFVI